MKRPYRVRAGQRAGCWGTRALCSPGRWRSGGSATWTHMTSCWRGTRRWTWSMGCCSTSCNRVTGQRCRAPEHRRGLQGAVGRGLPGRPLCSELCSSCACRVLQRTFRAASGREPLAHTPPSSPSSSVLCSPVARASPARREDSESYSRQTADLRSVSTLGISWSRESFFPRIFLTCEAVLQTSLSLICETDQK